MKQVPLRVPDTETATKKLVYHGSSVTILDNNTCLEIEVTTIRKLHTQINHNVILQLTREGVAYIY